MAGSSKVNGAAGICERNFHSRKEIEFMVEDSYKNGDPDQTGLKY